MSGLLTLALSGQKDNFLIYNPNFSYFRYIFKTNSFFYKESIFQDFNQDFNFGKNLSTTISKNGDLLSDIYLYLKISKN